MTIKSASEYLPGKDWLMIQRQRFYVFLNEHKDVVGIIWNKGDLETDKSKGTKQNWYGTAITNKPVYDPPGYQPGTIKGNIVVSFGELDTFSEVRECVENELK